MADKRISQLVDRGTVANNDVVPIVVSGATTTNKATISSIQTYMQGNLDLGVTSVGITLGSSGTDVSVSGSPITSSGNITINLPTASATNRGLLSAADWVTFNSKQDAGSFVTLDTTQTITAQKTFTTSGSSDTMIISHGSGSGFALDVLKAGNGEAIRVTKTSGSGNAMTISGGNFEAPTIVKTGGTSSQFLKADGSVDSNTYLTTGSAGSTYVPYSGAAANVDLGVYNLTASAIIANGSGSSSGIVHLESNAFHSLVNGYGSIASGTTNQFNLYQTTGAGVFRGAILSLNSITESATRTYTLPNADGTLALSTDLGAYLPLTGGTLTGALNGTSASFSGNLTFGNWKTDTNVFKSNKPNEQGAFLRAAVSSASNPTFAFEDDEDTGMYRVTTNSLGFTTGGINALTLSSTGAATFSSSVFAGGSVLSSPSGADTIIGAYGGQDCSLILQDANQLWELYVNDDFYINRGSTNVLTALRSNGNVGIGTASPSARLQINDSGAGAYTILRIQNRQARGAGVGARILLQPNNDFASTDTGAAISATTEGGINNETNLIFETGFQGTGTERMRITSGGTLLVNQTSSDAASGGSFFQLTQNNNNWIHFVRNSGTSGSVFGCNIVFSYAPNNTSSAFFAGGDTGAERYRMYSNGGLANYQANDVNLSDERTKKDIEPLESYWDKFKAIEIVKFKYKDQTHDDFNIGVIAQQVEAVAPEFVDVDGWDKPELDEEGNEIVSEEEPLKAIYTADLYHATIKVLQEAMAKIEKLETEINSLKNQMQ